MRRIVIAAFAALLLGATALPVEARQFGEDPALSILEQADEANARIEDLVKDFTKQADEVDARIGNLTAPPLPPGEGYKYTARELYQRCSKQAPPAVDALAFTYCLGYVRAAAHATLAGNERAYCYPDEGIAVGEYRTAFMRYYLRHPEVRLSPATIVVALAIGERWPCNKQ